jgi:hypothetical protein
MTVEICGICAVCGISDATTPYLFIVVMGLQMAGVLLSPRSIARWHDGAAAAGGKNNEDRNTVCLPAEFEALLNLRRHESVMTA